MGGRCGHLSEEDIPPKTAACYLPSKNTVNAFRISVTIVNKSADHSAPPNLWNISSAICPDKIQFGSLAEDFLAVRPSFRKAFVSLTLQGVEADLFLSLFTKIKI